MKKIDEGSFNSAFLGFDKKQVSEYIDSLNLKMEELKAKQQQQMALWTSEKENFEKVIEDLKRKNKDTLQEMEAFVLKIAEVEKQLTTEKSNNAVLTNNYKKLKMDFDLLSEKLEDESNREHHDMTAMGKVMLNVQEVCEKTISDAKNEADQLIHVAKKKVDECKDQVSELGNFYQQIKEGILEKMKVLEVDLCRIDEEITKAETLLTIDTSEKHQHISNEAEKITEETKDSLNVISIKKHA